MLIVSLLALVGLTNAYSTPYLFGLIQTQGILDVDQLNNDLTLANSTDEKLAAVDSFQQTVIQNQNTSLLVQFIQIDQTFVDLFTSIDQCMGDTQTLNVYQGNTDSVGPYAGFVGATSILEFEDDTDKVIDCAADYLAANIRDVLKAYFFASEFRRLEFLPNIPDFGIGEPQPLDGFIPPEQGNFSTTGAPDS